MEGLKIALLLAAAVVLWRRPGRRLPHRGPGAGGLRLRLRHRRRARTGPGGDAAALLVRELAGLLAAGRSVHRIWADAAALYDSAEPDAAPVHPFTPVLRAAAATAALGFSPAPVLAAAGVTNPSFPPAGVAAGAGSRVRESPEQALLDLWTGLAVCVRVSERSGAPLSVVLARYAGQLDAERTAADERDTALAGPRATVRLLTWLPAGGMLLGYLLGGNPLHVLTATPLGWAAAASGGGFWLAGRLWSARLVRAAAGPVRADPG